MTGPLEWLGRRRKSRDVGVWDERTSNSSKFFSGYIRGGVFVGKRWYVSGCVYLLSTSVRPASLETLLSVDF